MRRLFFVIFICLTTGIVVSAHPSGPVQQESAIEGGRKGVVDGYHETMWAHDYRLSVIELASHLNIDEYVYAPDQDPYVASSDWFMPYPQGSADRIKELMEACSRNGIVFTWCVRPDKDYSWSDADYNLLLGKFEMMHYMGVRSFGIILDDVPCEADEQWRKKELVERVNAHSLPPHPPHPLPPPLHHLHPRPQLLPPRLHLLPPRLHLLRPRLHLPHPRSLKNIQISFQRFC